MGEYDDRSKTTGKSKTTGTAKRPKQVDQASFKLADAEARIFDFSEVDGRLRLSIAKGKSHGVAVGIQGYVKAGRGALATFQIDEAKTNASFAFVDLTREELGDYVLMAA